MISDFRIYQLASAFMKDYGDDAHAEAMSRAEMMLALGNIEAVQLWLSVATATEALRRTGAPRARTTSLEAHGASGSSPFRRREGAE